MLKIKKEIEIGKFKNRLLSQEKDKKSVVIRQLKQKHFRLIDDNEERSEYILFTYEVFALFGKENPCLQSFQLCVSSLSSDSHHLEVLPNVILPLFSRWILQLTILGSCNVLLISTIVLALHTIGISHYCYIILWFCVSKVAILISASEICSVSTSVVFVVFGDK